MKGSIARSAIVRSDEGWALASVLWAVTMLSLMAAATQELTIAAHRTERRAWDGAVANATFQTGLTRAVAGISAPKPEDRWPVDGQRRDVAIEGVNVRIAIQDEAGRYDLNAVDGSILNLLFQNAGLDADSAAKLRDAVIDWRSSAAGHQLNGATDSDYAAAGLPYRPRHGAFQSVNEVQLVLGMSPKLFREVRAALTVYTKHTTIDPAYATEPALIAYFNGDRDKAAAALETRRTEPQGLSGAAGSAPSGALKLGTSHNGQVFEISEEAIISGHHFHRTVIVEFTGASPRPYFQLGFQ
jgi:general secretion pathway protein K